MASDIQSALNLVPDPQTRAVLQRIFEGVSFAQMGEVAAGTALTALPEQVSGPEIIAGSETDVRLWSPADVVAAIAEHESE